MRSVWYYICEYLDIGNKGYVTLGDIVWRISQAIISITILSYALGVSICGLVDTIGLYTICPDDIIMIICTGLTALVIICVSVGIIADIKIFECGRQVK